jgi:hypothetical protein
MADGHRLEFSLLPAASLTTKASEELIFLKKILPHLGIMDIGRPLE